VSTARYCIRVQDVSTVQRIRGFLNDMRYINPRFTYLLTYFSTRSQDTLPFCHLRPVCDQNSPTFHTWPAPVRGNTACDSQSANQ